MANTRLLADKIRVDLWTGCGWELLSKVTRRNIAFLSKYINKYYQYI